MKINLMGRKIMKIIDTLKKNYKDAKERELLAKESRHLEKQKKDIKFSDEDITEIIKLIGEQNPAWAELDPDILKMMFRLAMKQYKPKEEDFDISDRVLLRQKIADIFNNSDKITFSFNGKETSAGKISSADIKQLNDVYMRGKNLGSVFTKRLKSVFKRKMREMDK